MRETSVIKEFKYGIISSLDAEDIPQESASDSLNVDGDVGEGILRGIPTDTEILIDSDLDGTIDDAIAYIKQGEFIEHDGIYDLIYHDSYNNTISVITDFYGTTAANKRKLNIISSLSSDNVTLTLQNQQVHVGIDGYQGYWIGRMDHGLFDYGTSFAIASIANNSGTIVVTTTPTHSLKNGDIVKISDATGTDSASINGIWVVKTVNNFDKTFELTGSTYTGTTLTAPGTAALYLTYEVSQCVNFNATNSNPGYCNIASSPVAGGTAPGFFQANIYYKWGLSSTYDGLQESPIVGSLTGLDGTEYPYYDVVITAHYATPTNGTAFQETGLSAFNKRITAVNLYRADSTDDSVDNIGLYRLVASIDINDDNWGASTDHQLVTVRDYGTRYSLDAGTTIYPGNPVTYEENSGMPENLTDPALYYGLSTAGGGYHFVTKCTQATLAGSELRRIFKSKYFRYDMFDYYTDFLEMPEPLVALKYYEGFLYAFSLNKVYRINIEGFYIQDVFEDAGCHDQFSVTTNEQGMFFGNYNNVWMYQGGTFTRIGDAIRQSTSSGKSWATLTNNALEDLIVTSDAKKGYVLFINDYVVTGTTYNFMAWAYHPIKERWDCFTFGGYVSNANGGVFKGKDGEVYLSYATATQKLMRPTVSTYTQAWEWYSQDLIFGEPRQNKSIAMIKTDATGTVSINYGFEGATVNTAYTNETLINQYKKSIRIKLNAAAVTTGTAFTNFVGSMEVIYRSLIGKR